MIPPSSEPRPAPADLAGDAPRGRPAALVTRLWTDPDALMVIFAASSAEFAVNPIAEWLFFTGKLPADPIGRFVGTIRYMREIMLAPSEEAYVAACARIRGLHTAIEERRGRTIPDDAYRDVLLMGMQHSMRAHELASGRPIADEEAAAFVGSYRSMAHHMGVPRYPADYAAFRALRARRLALYRRSRWTSRLFASYRRALGPVGYRMLLALSPAVVEPRIRELTGLERGLAARAFERLFPWLRATGLHVLLLPPAARRMHRAARRMQEPATA